MIGILHKFKLIYFYLAAIVVTIVLGFVAFFCFQVKDAGFSQEDVSDFSTGWTYLKDNELQEIENLPVKLDDIKQYQKITIKNTLPDTYIDGMTICFWTSGQFVKVYIDDKVIYEFGTQDDRLFGKSPGNAWNLIRIPYEDVGKNISIELYSPYQQKAGSISEVLLGSKSACIFYILYHNMLGFIICSLLLILGIIHIIIYFILKKKIAINKSLLYLGMFSVNISIWSYSETHLMQLIFGNMAAVSFISICMLILVPMPILLFVRENTDIRYHMPLNIICILNMIVYFISTGLHVFGILDFVETIIMTHIIFVLSTITIIVINLIKRTHTRNEMVESTFGFRLIILALTVLIDMARYWLGYNHDNSFFVRIGLLVYISSLGFSCISESLNMITLGYKAQSLERLVYLDVLTNSRNRLAFNKEIETVMQHENDYDIISVIAFDLNNLKTINDTYGHNIGDRVIIEAARVIGEAFLPYGYCYRIGGDEFLVLALNCSTEAYMECILFLNNEMDKYNEKHIYKLSLAHGYASYNSKVDLDLTTVIKRADDLMYEMKRSMKQRMREEGNNETD